MPDGPPDYNIKHQLTPKQHSALLTGTLQLAFARAIEIANEANLNGTVVALIIRHYQIGSGRNKTMISRFDVMQ